MTDRELLELAAKVIGYSTYEYQPDIPRAICVRYEEKSFLWMPLIDDGDALRLAVKVGFPLSTVTNIKKALGEADPYAATRRAIVRAAAEIGKNMKGGE